MTELKISWERPDGSFHAHFDCFSGAAGDMMLAACLDAADESNRLLAYIQHCIEEGMPELKGEFIIQQKRVWRSAMGSVAANYVSVKSKYEHRAAPVPEKDSNAHPHKHESSDDHEHSHSHSSTMVYDHSHQHSHSHKSDETEHLGSHHEHSHAHEVSQHDHSHILHESSHGHEHRHGHEHNAKIDAHNDSHMCTEETLRSERQHDHSHSHSFGNTDHRKAYSAPSSDSHSHTHDHTSTNGPLRNLPQIQSLLENAPTCYISDWVKETAISAFTALAEAEALTHGSASKDDVHFHEVGAIDSIVDTVGTCIALYCLGVTTVSCSRLPLGEGTVWTDHGLLPVPAPATLRLMVGMATCPGPKGITGELVTPTAAALLKVLTAAEVSTIPGRPPSFTIQRVGIGAGTKDFNKHPNILRVLIGDSVVFDDRKVDKSSQTSC